MSSAAQVLANHANAQKSTGPQTPEGKAKCAQNARKHGLASAVLHLPDHQQLEFRQFEANLQSAVQPEGALETETCGQLVFAAWRLRQLHQAIADLYNQHQSDPLVTPECAAALCQLTRYRAALEMTFYRAIKQLRELQTRRAGRALQLHPPEQGYYPLQLNPSLYAKARHTRGSRQYNLETVGLLGPNAEWRINLDENFLPITPCERIRPRRE